MDFTLEPPSTTKPNAPIPAVGCDTCDGDRLVLVSKRRPVGSVELARLGNTPDPDEMYEEYAPCPDCNSGANTYFDRPDGSKFRSPDPALVRVRMRG